VAEAACRAVEEVKEREREEMEVEEETGREMNEAGSEARGMLTRTRVRGARNTVPLIMTPPQLI